MKFSRRMQHAQFTFEQLEGFYKLNLHHRLWNVYYDLIWTWLLEDNAASIELYNIDADEKGFWRKESNLMSDAYPRLLNYCSDIWRTFFGGNKKTLLSEFKFIHTAENETAFEHKINEIGHFFISRYIKTDKSAAIAWREWCKLYEFLEYSMERVQLILPEDNKKRFHEEINDILTEYEVGYQWVNGQFTLKSAAKSPTIPTHEPDFKNFADLIEQKLWIQSLRLENINAFAPTTILFEKQVTCFVGGNGSGKTTILRAIALGLVGMNGFKSDDLNLLAIRTAQKDKFYQKKGRIELKYQFRKRHATNAIEFRSIDFDKHFVVENGKSDFAINAADGLLKALVVGFAQQTVPTAEPAPNGDSPKIRDLESLILNKADGRFSEFLTWLKKLLTADAQADRILHRKWVADFLEVIHDITQDGITLTSETDAYVKTKHNMEGIPMDLMSQGYRNVFAWLGFLMKRLWEYRNTLTFEMVNFKQLPAVCLMDELDTYLHPEWQSRILTVLVKHFPNVQFIVTTHSPYIVGSVPKDLIQLYICDKQTIEPFMDFSPYGANIERLTERIFQTPARVQAVAQDVADLRTTIQNNAFENAAQLLTKLEQAGVGDDDNDPEIGSLKILLRTKKRKAAV